MDGDLEVCCVCLDFLSSAPVAALLTGSSPACPHYVHADCARRLRPRRCPLCRLSFTAPSLPISRGSLFDRRPEQVLQGLRLLAGRQGLAGSLAATAPSRKAVELLAAVLPIRQASLEVLVAEELASSAGNLADRGELGAESLGRVLRQLGLGGAEGPYEEASEGSQTKTLPAGYNQTARLARLCMRALLKAAGATGAAVHLSLWGVCFGALLGSLAALPRLRLGLPEHSDFDDMDLRTLLVLGVLLGLLQLAWHSLKDPRWVKRCGRWGAIVGGTLGWLLALAKVDPESHGLRSVFMAGLRGRTLQPALAAAGLRRRPAGLPRPCVDIFAGLSQAASSAARAAATAAIKPVST